jgi:hypothetical protein
MTRYLPPGCVVYVDKGFLLADILPLATPLNITFKIPPRKAVGADQFAAHDTEATAAVANVRIVVENVIGQVASHWPFVKAPHAMVQVRAPFILDGVTLALCKQGVGML